MFSEFFLKSKGAGSIHVCRWTPESKPVAVVQIVHGIAEYAERYDEFARYLNGLGYLVVAEDHMGHGKSINSQGIQGYFHGGWFTAVDDTYELLQMTRREFPDIPYVLFGHSMGSFMSRTILSKYPNSGISAAILCGTGWQTRGILTSAIGMCQLVCRMKGEQKPSSELEKLVFANYNQKVEHPRTPVDWLTRDSRIVDEYIADPLCGFTPTAGLMRELMRGIRFVQQPENLAAMKKELPVLFVSGGDDPVGSYGKGVLHAAEAFRKSGVQHVTCKIYPLGRHEILNEINREEIYQDISSWISRALDG